MKKSRVALPQLVALEVNCQGIEFTYLDGSQAFKMSVSGSTLYLVDAYDTSGKPYEVPDEWKQHALNLVKEIVEFWEEMKDNAFHNVDDLMLRNREQSERIRELEKTAKTATGQGAA